MQQDQVCAVVARQGGKVIVPSFAIGRAQDRLRRDAPPGAIRWTRPDQFHVTLKYLGDVPLAQIAALEVSVGAACAGCPTFQLTARSIGFFPNEQKPRVIWAGVDDHEGQLAELHRRLDKAMQPFAPSGKPEQFTGHITLGRFKPGKSEALRQLAARLTLRYEQPFGDWQTSVVEIVRSELTSDGAVHTPIAALRLAG